MLKNPGRRWFQFHLATGLFLTLGSGGMLWANFQAKPFTTPDQEFLLQCYDNRKRMTVEGVTVPEGEYGWPCVVMREQKKSLLSEAVRKWYWDSLKFNIVAELCIATSVAMASECWLRRRDRLKARTYQSNKDDSVVMGDLLLHGDTI